jgi:tRNA 5-methylaminomethyl-2-thiouridine biosynthesis bifunctional protein
MLHFASVEAWPVSAADILRSTAAWPELQPLAQQLADAWWGLVPGIHRLSFDQGRVLLTVAVGDVLPMLRDLVCEADAVFLDGFAADSKPQMWALDTLKSLARHCRRGTRLATWSTTPVLRQNLQQLGFVVHRRRGLPPKRRALTAAFDPAWPLKRSALPRTEASRAVVIGGGLAGGAVAASLARRGWQVQVLDAAAEPAHGASGLPVGLMVPHVSPDDAYVSRATRAGIRLTLQATQALLTKGVDWQQTGAHTRATGKPLRLPTAWGHEGGEWSAPWATADAPGLHHVAAAWIKPHALARAWLAQPGITWQGDAAVARVSPDATGTQWQALDAAGEVLAEAPLMVLCAASGCESLLEPWAPIRVDRVTGQVVWGDWPADEATNAALPVSAEGHFIPNVAWPGGPRWLSGSTYERTPLAALDQSAGLAANRQRLAQHYLELMDLLQPQFERGDVQVWAGERCTTHDRLPLVGPVALPAGAPAGLQVCTGMGSRGLTFAALCAELLAARLHGEPVPVERSLALAFDASRTGCRASR